MFVMGGASQDQVHIKLIYDLLVYLVQNLL